MKKFQYRNLLITLFGIIVFEFIDFHKKKVEAQFLNKNDFEQENTKLKSSDFDEKITISKFSNSNYFYKKEFIKVLKGVDNKINNFLAFDKNSPNQKFNLDIISDIQYQQNNKFYAEGNAVVYFSNATLKADLITFDETKKIFTAEGNVIFSKGKHIIEGSSFEFNSKTGNGSFNDAYGILDLKNFNKDFDLKAIDAEAEALGDEFHRLMSTSTYKGKNVFVSTAGSEYVSLGGRDAEMTFGIGTIAYSNLYVHNYETYYDDQGLTGASDANDKIFAARNDLKTKVVIDGAAYGVRTKETDGSGTDAVAPDDVGGQHLVVQPRQLMVLMVPNSLQPEMRP